MTEGHVSYPSPQNDEARREAQSTLAGRFGLALGMSHETGPSRLTPEASETKPAANEDLEKYRGIWGESPPSPGD